MVNNVVFELPSFLHIQFSGTSNTGQPYGHLFEPHLPGSSGGGDSASQR